MLTRSQLVAHLATSSGLKNQQIVLFLDTLVALAEEQCRTAGAFVIPGLGKAIKIDRKARAGRDETGHPVLIPAKTLVKFRLDVGFKNTVLSDQKENDGKNNGPKGNRLLQKCPECGVPVREDRFQRHLRRMHGWDSTQASRAHELLTQRRIGATQESANQEAAAMDEVSVETLSFELLPPGTWDIEHVIAYYRREAHRFPKDLVGREIQWTRLNVLKSLRPARCFVGTELWLGYVLFEFSWSSRVVLECPVKGNVTYVLSGDWKRVVRHTKLYLRTKYPRNYTKIVHKGEWLDRIKAAL